MTAPQSRSAGAQPRPPKRRRRHASVNPDYALDRRRFASRLEAALVADRSTYRSLARHIGVPDRQIRALAHARPVLDWAYHATALWVGEVETRSSRARASRRQRAPGLTAADVGDELPEA